MSGTMTDANENWENWQTWNKVSKTTFDANERNKVIFYHSSYKLASLIRGLSAPQQK